MLEVGRNVELCDVKKKLAKVAKMGVDKGRWKMPVLQMPVLENAGTGK